ncbi:MAG: class I SAM-dependent methyltransferase [Anaerolineales bacterium]
MAELTWLDRLEATRLYQRLRYAMNRGLVAFFRRNVFAARSGLRVAEMACGSGYGAHLLAQEESVALSLAADLNLEDYSQANIQAYQASFVLLDLFRPALASGSLDLVWNSSSIEELDNPQQAVAAMTRLARPGGWVFVGVPNKYGPAAWLRLIPNRRTRAWLGRVYSRPDLRKLLASAGLEIQAEMSYLGGVFIGMLGRKPDTI